MERDDRRMLTCQDSPSASKMMVHMVNTRDSGADTRQAFQDQCWARLVMWYVFSFGPSIDRQGAQIECQCMLAGRRENLQ